MGSLAWLVSRVLFFGNLGWRPDPIPMHSQQWGLIGSNMGGGESVGIICILQ